MATTQNQVNGKDAQQGPLLNVHNIYVKDLSLESPNTPQIFNAEWNPKVDFDLQLHSEVIEAAQHIYEVTLHITVTVKLKEEKTAFLVDVKQAGIFTLQHFSDDILKQVLGITCPTVIFPYARETISNMVQRAGFPQLLLPTINFEAMYAHQSQEQAKAATDQQTVVV